jgi:hypothetical protein
MAAKKYNRKPSIPPDFPYFLKNVVIRGWSKEPNERPSLEKFKSALLHTQLFLAKQRAHTIEIVKQNHPVKLLSSTVNIAEKTVVDKNDEIMEIVKSLKELAVEYSQLQNKTQGAVWAIRSYGEDCQKVAVDFLIDGNVTEFLKEQRDIEELKHSLKDVCLKHHQIK